MANPHTLCMSDNGFTEKGISVKLNPKKGETVAALVVDGCIITDNNTKCDGLFVLVSPSKCVMALVELKGRDILHALEQLAYVRNQRSQYKQLKQLVTQQSRAAIVEKAFVISSFTVDKVDRESLETQYNGRVAAILHSRATTTVPDLRQYI